MGLMNFMQDPRAMPYDMAAMSGSAAGQFKGNDPRLAPLRPQAPMPSFSQAMDAGPQSTGINPAAMQFISQMMSQPGGLMGGLMNYGTPWEFGTPVGMPALMGREAIMAPGTVSSPPEPSPALEMADTIIRHQGSQR